MNSKITLTDLLEVGMATGAQPEDEIRRSPKNGITIPQGLDLDDLLEYVERLIRAKKEVIEQYEDFEHRTYADVCVCLWRVVQRIEGMGAARSAGPNPSERIFECGYDRQTGEMRRETAPTGQIMIPGVGVAAPGVRPNGTTYVSFRLVREDQPRVLGLLELVKRELQHNSIYRGQIIDTMHNFIDVTGHDRTKLAFNESVKKLVDASIYKKILNVGSNRRYKHSVLLTGEPGTGKSEIIRTAMSYLFELGYGGIQVAAGATAREVAQALNMARLMMRDDTIVGIFIEDIEKMTQGHRSQVLDLFDGPESKADRVLFVMTTNFEEQIGDPAFLRPGRVDTIIRTEVPDAECFERLVRMRLAPEVEVDVDFKKVYPLFEGMTPAWVDNAINKIHDNAPDGVIEKLTTEDLELAVLQIKNHWDLMLRVKELSKAKPPTLDTMYQKMVEQAIEEQGMPQAYLDQSEVIQAVETALSNRGISDSDDVYNIVKDLIDETRVSIRDKFGEVTQKGELRVDD